MLSCVLACNACELAIMSARNNVAIGWLRKRSRGRCYIYCSRACNDDVPGGEL